MRYEVVGFMRRTVRVDNIPYSWGEYLLHNVERGYAWVLTRDKPRFGPFVQAVRALTTTPVSGFSHQVHSMAFSPVR